MLKFGVFCLRESWEKLQVDYGGMKYILPRGS